MLDAGHSLEFQPPIFIEALFSPWVCNFRICVGFTSEVYLLLYIGGNIFFESKVFKFNRNVVVIDWVQFM